MNYELNRKYFHPPKYGLDILLIILGGVLLFLLPPVGVVLIGTGIIIIVVKKQKSVLDVQYDAEVAKALQGLKEKALNKLVLDEDEVKEIDPIFFDGFVYRDASFFRSGKDGKLRTNKYEATYLFFSEHGVHCYTLNFDTTVEQQSEKTDIFFYQDIVSASTVTETETVFGQNKNVERFVLTTAGGNNFSVSLRDIDNAYRSINAMRTRIKKKKIQN